MCFGKREQDDMKEVIMYIRTRKRSVGKIRDVIFVTRMKRSILFARGWENETKVRMRMRGIQQL